MWCAHAMWASQCRPAREHNLSVGGEGQICEEERQPQETNRKLLDADAVICVHSGVHMVMNEG